MFGVKAEPISHEGSAEKGYLWWRRARVGSERKPHQRWQDADPVPVAKAGGRGSAILDFHFGESREYQRER